MIRKCKQHGYFRGDLCPECDDEGRYVLDDEREERLGRFVSGSLRHFPDDVGLEMDLQGWVDMDILCDIMKKRYKWGTMERLVSLVESDKKGRYEIDGSFIRARYGHSVEVDLVSDYPENDLPYLYYGVSQEEADMLLENGITPVRQCYVHLSTSLDKAMRAASIHTENPVIFEIDAVSAQENGIDIVVVNDDIVLAKSIPAEYISIKEFGE
ncbi:RNA 2'-phosphotransferase [Methanolobus sp. ZRKC2]|uniref:RNA 2'-phosphotransferase n=1 Tax=Methanolobus sp. ZRKC2 TaxID=3125783 RepID=UPI00324CCDD8